MKDELRELAGEMRNELCSDFAQKLEAILDADGGGGAVGDAKEYLDNCVNALDHIARTARNCRVTSKRLTWIASRAESAISGNDDWRDAPVPKNGTSALLRAQARIKELEAELPHPARSGVVSDATPEMCDSVRYLLVGMERPGRTFGTVREHCRFAGMDVENWPDWTLNRDTEHFNKSACAALIWWLMHRAAIQGERHEG